METKINLVQWSCPPNYDELYEVSSVGELKGVDRISKRSETTTRKLKGKLKTQNICRLGYLRSNLYKDGKVKTWQIHQLVALTFIPNPENKPCVNHINRIKTDNRVENLEWCTHRENTAHWRLLSNKTSKYVGVHWDKKSEKWRASIRIKKKLFHLGCFKNEIDAHHAYINAEKQVLDGTFIKKINVD